LHPCIGNGTHANHLFVALLFDWIVGRILPLWSHLSGDDMPFGLNLPTDVKFVQDSLVIHKILKLVTLIPVLDSPCCFVFLFKCEVGYQACHPPPFFKKILAKRNCHAPAFGAHSNSLVFSIHNAWRYL
jgi:hypothetical protein